LVARFVDTSSGDYIARSPASLLRDERHRIADPCRGEASFDDHSSVIRSDSVQNRSLCARIVASKTDGACIPVTEVEAIGDILEANGVAPMRHGGRWPPVVAYDDLYVVSPTGYLDVDAKVRLNTIVTVNEGVLDDRLNQKPETGEFLEVGFDHPIADEIGLVANSCKRT
jgi:hypothetical protein